MPATETPPILPPKEAIDWFRRKGWVFAFDWEEIWASENVAAFTVAKIMSRDLLEDVRAAVDSAIANGESLGTFAKNLRPTLQAKGWWGKKEEVDPATGETREVQLGSPQRLRTIYRTNMTTAYQAGRWERIQRQKATFPFLVYITVDDSRVRDEHKRWHYTILPVDHPWWKTHYPPNDWGCRCVVIAVNQRWLDRRGLKVTEKPHFAGKRKYTNKRTGEIIEVEKGIGPGWDYNVGEAPKDGFTVRGLKSVQAAAIVDVPASAADERRYRQLQWFLGAGFGLKDAAAAARGMIFRGEDGWPVSIALSMFDGGPMPTQFEQRAIADAMIEPNSIGWVWVRGRDSRVMLVRRYTGADGTVVDFGKDWWRWRLAGSRTK